MNPAARFVAVLSAASLVHAASAQLIGPVPPAPEPSPEFKPPAPPPPPPAAPAKPAEAEKPLPSLVERGPDGRLRRYPEGAELAAIAAYPFDDAARGKIAASRAARAADIQRMVIDKLPQALEARRTALNLDQVKDFNEFARIKEVAAPLASEKVSDRLMRDGAITPLERGKLDQIAKEYDEQLKQEWQGQTGTDILKIASLIAREKFNEVTRDAMEALDTLMLAAAPGLDASQGGLSLRPDQQAGLQAALGGLAAIKGDDDTARRARIAVMDELVLKTLDADQAKTLLSAGLPR